MILLFILIHIYIYIIQYIGNIGGSPLISRKIHGNSNHEIIHKFVFFRPTYLPLKSICFLVKFPI